MARKRTVGSNAEVKMKRKAYEQELRKLQVELCHLQDWVKKAGARIIILFEGRDAAGKGGTIKAITERVSPRVFRVVALPAPSDREKTQMFGQRYIEQFPAAGEIVIFDRSWYNRAGVEYVMGFCSEEQHQRFLNLCPEIEKYIVDAGIILIKFWLEVGKEEQERRKQVCVVLDQRGLTGEPLERAVEFAAALVTRELDAGAEVSLALAGEFLPGASGGAQRHAALRQLALVQPGVPGLPAPQPDPKATVLEVRP